LFIIFSWGVAELVSKYQVNPWYPAFLASAALLICSILTHVQLRHWQNTETLFKHALAVTDHNITAYFGLGKACAEQGRSQEALTYLQSALNIKPDFADVQGQVGQILASQGHTDEAIAHYHRALELRPTLVEALNNLAWLLATYPDPKYRNGPEAVRLAQRACELTHFQRTIFVGTLAAAYAEAGRFPEAIQTAQKAHDLAVRWNEPDLASRNLSLMKLYQSGQAYRETASLPLDERQRH
jgi:tetratricopeptide (TPR) repeat protein